MGRVERGVGAGGGLEGEEATVLWEGEDDDDDWVEDAEEDVVVDK